MALRPLNDTFLFAFFNDTAGGCFIERNAGKIILTNQDLSHQGTRARWGKVLAVGPHVKEFGVGDIVLIEAGKWTVGFKHDDVQVWKSDEGKVLATGEDESVTFEYLWR